MSLGERLGAVASLVPQGVRVADIGTDHAYLPINLCQNGVVTAAIAADVNKGPYQVALASVAAAGLSGKIEVRLGDGLKVLVPGEVDVVTIAGMGGALMQELLTASIDILAGLSGLILQPMNAGAGLRKWLYQHGWHINDEVLVLEDERLYEILYAVPGKGAMPDDMLLSVGPIIWQKKDPLLRCRLEQLLSQERRILQGLASSDRAKSTEKYLHTMQKIEKLEALSQW